MARMWKSAATVAALMAAVAACGGSPGDDGADDVASLGSAATTTDDTTATSDAEVTEEDREEAMLAFVECMREQGIDMPDPQTDGGGVAIAIEGEEVDMEEFEAANEVCQPLMEDAMGDIDIDPEQQAEMHEQLLEYAQCMRDHGIDMPDPEFDDGRITMTHESDAGDGGDFEAADAECATDEMRPDGGPTGEGPSNDISGGSDGDEGPGVVIRTGAG